MPESSSRLDAAERRDSIDKHKPVKLVAPSAKPKPGALRRVLLENLPLKLIAAIVAVILFALVRQDAGTSTWVEVALLVRVPQGYVLLDEPPETISVKLRGRESELRELRVDEIGPISISPAPTAAQIKHTLQANSLALPVGIEIESFEPPAINLALEERATRRVPINAEKALSGTPPPGYQLGAVRFTPDEIEISGPRSVVESVNSVLVEPLTVTGRTAAFEEERFVVPDRRRVKIEGSAKVLARVDIVPKARERVVLGVPVLALDLPRPHEILPAVIDLVLVGEEAALAQLDPAKLVVTIDGRDDQLAPARTRQVLLEAQNVHNLPQGVGVDERRLPTLFLRTIPEELPEPVPVPVPLDPTAPDQGPP